MRGVRGAFTRLQWGLPGHALWRLTDTSRASDTKACLSPPGEAEEKHADQYKRKTLFISHNDVECFSPPHRSLQPPVASAPCPGQTGPRRPSLACQTGWEFNQRKMTGCPGTPRTSGFSFQIQVCSSIHLARPFAWTSPRKNTMHNAGSQVTANSPGHRGFWSFFYSKQKTTNKTTSKQ